MEDSKKLCVLCILVAEPDISVSRFYTKTYNTVLYFFLVTLQKKHVFLFLYVFYFNIYSTSIRFSFDAGRPQHIDNRLVIVISG